METAATKQHAHPNTVFHCLYGYYNLGYSRKELARVYNKTERTISNWVRVYEETRTFQQSKTTSDRKFTARQRQWLYQYYQEKPLSYLDEAQATFTQAHRVAISKTSVWRIIHDFGLIWKVLEHRAMHVKESDISRFVEELEELSNVNWCHQNVVFLDEVSFDNRGMIRRQGYAMGGKKVAIRGDFSRKPRISILAFIGVNGLLDYYDTESTFDHITLTKCCQEFMYSGRGYVRQYPGSNSVWILDGATIHRHLEIIHSLHSVGVVPIFLPAYSPFFNPIEFMFGYMSEHVNDSAILRVHISEHVAFRMNKHGSHKQVVERTASRTPSLKFSTVQTQSGVENERAIITLDLANKLMGNKGANLVEKQIFEENLRALHFRFSCNEDSIFNLGNPGILGISLFFKCFLVLFFFRFDREIHTTPHEFAQHLEAVDTFVQRPIVHFVCNAGPTIVQVHRWRIFFQGWIESTLLVIGPLIVGFTR